MTMTQDSKKKRYAPDDMNRNPTGKGGFGDNPQNINGNKWVKEASIPHQMRVFLNMSIEDIEQWEKDNPVKKRTPAQQIALNSVKKSIDVLDYQKETTDRTSGRAVQFVEQTTEVKAPIILDTSLIDEAINEDNDSDKKNK